MNTEFSHGRRVIQTGDVYQVVTPIRTSDRAFLRYYLAQYRLAKRKLGEANRAKDSERIGEALRRVSAFRRHIYDLMLAMRQKQVTSAYERDNAKRLEDLTSTDGIKVAIFNHARRAAGVV